MVRRLSGHVVEINQMSGSVHHRKDDGRTSADLVELKQLNLVTVPRRLFIPALQ